MRLCVDTGCQTLNWTGDHYDGYGDGDPQIGTRYWLISWKPDHVELSGKTAKAADGVYPAEGIFTGTIAPGNESLAGGVMAWRIGYDKSGKVPFTLTWGKQLSSNTAASVAAANPKPPPPLSAPISMPPGTPPRPAESIVDVEIPDAKHNWTPPPAPQWHELTNPVARYDLNGTWVRDGIDHVERISVFQLRDVVVIRNLQGRPWFLPNGQLAAGSFSAPGTVEALVFDDDTVMLKMKEHPAVFAVTDADHFELVNSVYPSESSKYHRISQDKVPDIPCDYRNPAHISGEMALAIGDAYFRNNDLPTTRCWWYLSAKMGNADGEALYGQLLVKAEGAEKNVEQGALWVQSAAMRGSVYAAVMLSNLFHDGAGMPQSDQRAAYWQKRYLGLSDSYVHNPAEHNRANNAPHPWMSDTAGSCEATNPSHTSADDALKMGRVAYEARALQTAHCWFRVSARQGSAKAYTYLGLMSAFGMGVEANPENGLAYLYKAAQEKDAYAAIFLANFYRYGVGAPADDNQARSEMQYAMNLPDGMSVFSRLEGALINNEAWDVMMSGSYSPDQQCLARERSRPGGRSENCYNAAEAHRVGEANKSARDRLSEAQKRTILDQPEEMYPERPSW